MTRILRNVRTSMKRLDDAGHGPVVVATDDTAAQALHSADRILNFMRWDQLSEDTKAEYRRDADRLMKRLKGELEKK